MKKSQVLGGGLTLLASFMLVACNSNDDDNAAIPAVAQTAQVTITPSLGKVLNAKVVLKNAKTGVTLGSGNTGNTGVATFTATKTSDPVVAEVQGQAGAKYFDESKKAELDFAAGQILRVITPTFTSNIGVSTLTEVAYQAAVKKAGSATAITSDIATAANEAIRKALAPELSSITTAPTVIGSAADLAMLANTNAGKYALKLAALAELAKTDTMPALAVLNQLAADITADDKLDGIATGKDVTFTYTNSNLVSQITTNINGVISTANLSGVGFNVSTFSPVMGNIVITITNGGGTGSGCVLSVAAPSAPIVKVCYKNLLQNAVCGTSNIALNAAAQAYASAGATLSFAQGSCAGADFTVDFSL